ncbi:MAG: hypothetical protein LBR26_10785 [Prevotella sp.]|nr:hypothetical protein [Prevotella sp.]
MFGNCPVHRYIQSSGCFFPAAGFRLDSNGLLYYVGNYGAYWSSSPSSSSSAYGPDFDGGSYVDPFDPDTRPYGLSVRCVKEFILVF